MTLPAGSDVGLSRSHPLAAVTAEDGKGVMDQGSGMTLPTESDARLCRSPPLAEPLGAPLSVLSEPLGAPLSVLSEPLGAPLSVLTTLAGDGVSSGQSSRETEG